MRVLVALVHYFRGEADPRHASTDGRLQAVRKRRVEMVVEAYRGLFGRPATIDIEGKRFQHGSGGGDRIDLAVVTVPGCSLLDADFLRRHGVVTIEAKPDDPRFLGFHAHELFARLRAEYDLFCYSEDDLRPVDPDLFAKLAWFADGTGGARVLSPNRYEWNPAGPAIKTYVDGDLRAGFVDPLLALRPDVDTLTLDALGRPRLFRRARNPHSGFFAVTQAQLGAWMRMGHWLDRDASFVSPLESAATLGLAKAFPVFKPFGASAAFLELEHLDTRFSGLNLPWESRGLAAAGSAGT